MRRYTTRLKRPGVKSFLFFDIIKTMIKIAFFDIDGTLYDNKAQEWKKKSLDAIKKAQDMGVKCVLCTSRPYHSMLKLKTFDQGVIFDGWIGSCGGVATLNNEIVFLSKVNENIVRRFIERCKKDGYTMEIVGVYERTLLFGQTNESKNFYSFFNESIPPLGEYDGEDVVTINFFAPSKAGEIYRKDFPELFINEYIPTSFDVMEKKHRKSDGMLAILNKLGLRKEEAIAFGDDIPDIDMLNAAKYLVCMGQGKDEVKEKATYIANTVSDDGVLDGLKHYGLIGEDYE